MSEQLDVIYEKWPIPTEFPVTIASQEVERVKYRSVVGKSGIKWYVGVCDNPADHLYCTDSNEWDKAGDGFGGRNITMHMEDGTTEVLRGGWHSNAEAYFQDTGEDVRDKHKTFVVLALRRDAEHLYDVLYRDSEPQISEFRRGENMAKEIAQRIGSPVVSFSRSATGAVIGTIYP